MIFVYNMLLHVLYEKYNLGYLTGLFN